MGLTFRIDPFDPTAPAISKDKPLMVGTNRDEMAFFYWERKATDIFTLTDDGLKSHLDKDFGADAEKNSGDVSQEPARRFAGGPLRCDYKLARHVAWLD